MHQYILITFNVLYYIYKVI